VAGHRIRRWWRLILLAILVLALAPVTWIRTGPWQPVDERQLLQIEPLAVPARTVGPFTIVGAWELNSSNSYFGGYSGLVALGDGTLLAASDKGSRLRFTVPGGSGPTPEFASFVPDDADNKRAADIEAITRDPISGKLWLAYENSNTIERYEARLRLEARVKPAALRNWPTNSGPEAMVRLADGRFVVLAEATEHGGVEGAPALLFAHDPLTGVAPLEFRFRPPAGFRAVDMAQLPDGRVLILVRKVLWGLPPRFANQLVLADPDRIREDPTWQGEVIADLAAPLPSDNYEGLAIETEPGGSITVWIVSDDNSFRLQKTLLLQLRWRPNEKARGLTARPNR
jgi:hypothetical protein